MKAQQAQQLIIGSHSLKAALLNPKRTCLDFYATQEGLKNFLKYNKMSRQDVSNRVKNIHVLDAHRFQQSAQKLFKDLGFEFSRITSGVFLLAKTLPQPSWQELLKISKNKKIVALDHVTDVHNAAAIIRSCAFYDVGAVIVEVKGSFSLSPGLIRVASGGVESVAIFSTHNLPATLRQLKEQGLEVVGLSEEATISVDELGGKMESKDGNICLVFGSEDKGLSHAAERELSSHLSIPSANNAVISSLNVSVAVAVTLERLRKN